MQRWHAATMFFDAECGVRPRKSRLTCRIYKWEFVSRRATLTRTFWEVISVKQLPASTKLLKADVSSFQLYKPFYCGLCFRLNLNLVDVNDCAWFTSPNGLSSVEKPVLILVQSSWKGKSKESSQVEYGFRLDGRIIVSRGKSCSVSLTPQSTVRVTESIAWHSQRERALN